MWKNVLYSCGVYYFFVLVLTAPANSYSRGPQYTVNAPNPPKQPYIEVKNSTYHGAGPREEARAMCSVRTQEVNATANATITRRLHGVVTSKELHNAIQRLEVIIYGQMQQLWQSLDALRTHMSTQPSPQRQRAYAYPDRRSVSFRYVPNNLDALRTHMSTQTSPQRQRAYAYPDRRSVSFRYVPNK